MTTRNLDYASESQQFGLRWKRPDQPKWKTRRRPVYSKKRRPANQDQRSRSIFRSPSW